MTLSIRSQAEASHLGYQRPISQNPSPATDDLGYQRAVQTKNESTHSLPLPPSAESKGWATPTTILPPEGSIARGRLDTPEDRPVEAASSVPDLKDYRLPTQRLNE